MQTSFSLDSDVASASLAVLCEQLALGFDVLFPDLFNNGNGSTLHSLR
jgi:hypothetical protein